jgi:hypothetical protein
MVKLYSYSSKSLNFVEAKWFTAKYAIGGILIGIIILFGAIEMNQSVAKALGSHSTNTLAAENNFLRYQVNFISAKVNNLEMQATQLHERANNLHLLLHGGKNVGDTVPSFNNATDGLKPQLLISAARSFRP